MQVCTAVTSPAFRCHKPGDIRERLLEHFPQEGVLSKSDQLRDVRFLDGARPQSLSSFLPGPARNTRRRQSCDFASWCGEQSRMVYGIRSESTSVCPPTGWDVGHSRDHSFPPSAHPVFAGNDRNGKDRSLVKAPEDGQIGPWYMGSPEVEGGNVVRPGSHGVMPHPG